MSGAATADLIGWVAPEAGVLGRGALAGRLGRAEARVANTSATHVPLDVKSALQNVVDRSVADLAANPALARDLMSPGSYMHLVKGTRLADASYGKAIERLAARYVKEDPTLSAVLKYQSRPFVTTPDFFGHESYNLRMLDITTSRAIPNHLLRPYGHATEYVTHPGLPKWLVFPQ